MPTFPYTLAGLVAATVPASTSIEVREAIAGGRAGAMATLYTSADKSTTAANPVTSTSQGALPAVYAVPGAYVLVMGGETRTVGVAPDPSEDRAEGLAYSDDLSSLGGTYLTVVEHGATASTARPDAVQVAWVGTVEPENIEAADRYLNPVTGEEWVYDGTDLLPLGSGGGGGAGVDGSQAGWSKEFTLNSGAQTSQHGLGEPFQLTGDSVPTWAEMNNGDIRLVEPGVYHFQLEVTVTAAVADIGVRANIPAGNTNSMDANAYVPAGQAPARDSVSCFVSITQAMVDDNWSDYSIEVQREGAAFAGGETIEGTVAVCVTRLG